ncbi:MAG: stage II sporulation protein M [archaeon]
MVLEQLIATRWVERKPWHAFSLGLVFSFLGMLGASLIYGANPSYMAVALTAIFIVPSLNKLLELEENVEIREKKLSLRLLFRDHKDIVEIYFFLFLGIMVAYSLVAILSPIEVSRWLFQSQLGVGGLTGLASGSGIFVNILLNNLLVMVVVFVLSWLYGSGAILFLSWNAAVWGVISGFVARGDANVLASYAGDLLVRMPHTLLELFAYILVAVAGGVLSKAVIREKIRSAKFTHVVTDGMLFFAIAVVCILLGALIETMVLS